MKNWTFDTFKDIAILGIKKTPKDLISDISSWHTEFFHIVRIKKKYDHKRFHDILNKSNFFADYKLEETIDCY